MLLGMGWSASVGSGLVEVFWRVLGAFINCIRLLIVGRANL